MALNQYIEIYRLYRNPHVKLTDKFFLDLPEYVSQFCLYQNKYQSNLYTLEIHLFDSFENTNIHKVNLNFNEKKNTISFYGITGGERTVEVDQTHQGKDALLTAIPTIVYEVLHYVPKGLEAKQQKSKAQLYMSLSETHPEQNEILKKLYSRTRVHFSVVRIYRYSENGIERFELYGDPHKNAYMFVLKHDKERSIVSCRLNRCEYGFMNDDNVVDSFTLLRVSAIVMKIYKERYFDNGEDDE